MIPSEASASNDCAEAPEPEAEATPVDPLDAIPHVLRVFGRSAMTVFRACGWYAMICHVEKTNIPRISEAVRLHARLSRDAELPEEREAHATLYRVTFARLEAHRSALSRAYGIHRIL